MTRLAENTIVDARYRVTGRIGTGGMAEVYCAEDLQLGRTVALKLLYDRFASDEAFVDRFHREASSAAGLQHPNVVSIYDRGEWDGQQYIAMEFVDGRTLKELIADEAPLEPVRAALIAIQVLRAARFAHRRGIIHRDFKPQNVMIDAEGRVKVTDFGIALAGPSDETETGSIMGTAQYLSPEQAQGLPVSAQSDLYSVGLLLDELLTGRVAFDGDSAVTVALKQVNEVPEPPSAFNAAVGPLLDAAVARALEKDPARRYADADEFIATLERAVAEQQTGFGIVGGFPATGFLATGAAETAEPYPGGEDFSEAYGRPAEPLVPEPERDRGNIWWIALAVVLGIAALAIAGVLVFGSSKVTVPAVVGSSRQAATATLSGRGFRVGTATQTSDAPVDSVVAQAPRGGAKVSEGATVTLVLSSGPGTAAIPSVTGRPASTALTTLQGAGFKVTVEKQASTTVPENHAIATDPASGVSRVRGSDVTLLVSSGPQRVKVPGVVGQARADALAALQDAGFKVAVSSKQTSADDPGTVLAQDPAAGALAGKGATVAIVVAKQPTEVAVPDVVGRSQDDATTALSAADFTVVTRSRTVTDPAQDGKVLSVSPTGRHTRGTRVTITVGKLQTSTTTPSTATTPTPTTSTPTTTTPPTTGSGGANG